MWGVSCGRGIDCFGSCSLLLSCGVFPAKCRRGSGKKQTKNGKKKNAKKGRKNPQKIGIPVGEANAEKREKNKEKGGKKRAEWQGWHEKK
jgi:hypothetical protein